MKTKQLVLSLLLVAAGLMSGNARTFGDALKRNEIKFEVVSVPGPRRMLLKIKNLMNRDTRVNLEPGRFFYNTPSVQPFVISRPLAIELDAGEEREVAIRAYCGNSSASCPTIHQKFNKTEMGPANLTAVLQMMHKYRIVGDNLYQQVIWFYSNKHQLASVYSYDADEMSVQRVQQFICEKERLKMPTYRIKYSPAVTGDELEFSGRPDEVEGKLKFQLANRSDLHVQVSDSLGNQIAVIEVHLDQPAGLVELPVIIRVVDYPLGEYTVAVSDEKGNILVSMPVKVS